MPVTTRSASKRDVAKITSTATDSTKKISKSTSTRTKKPSKGKAKATSAILKRIQDGLSPKQPVPVVRMAMTEADAQDEYMPGSVAFAAKFPQIVIRPLYAAIEDRYANLMLERIRRMENGFTHDMREKSGAEREARAEEITWIYEHSRRGEIHEKYYDPIPGKPWR
ncbi:hypothetical protein LTR56_002696 [Elasticomyces elasticus]|nr:hypothetical protein LTR22_014888 [Elasticomyces elasticus]KAK3657180.1 hypothetical protein LTR56_002696 [Elasticomyces elasticus]KAK4914347.1 hypothetical protein LTR49_017378 [Elasticomyces elasticus]KAK5753872.1 hypothetical protein LTS12_016075 [Elasticomyces elasticus]